MLLFVGIITKRGFSDLLTGTSTIRLSHWVTNPNNGLYIANTEKRGWKTTFLIGSLSTETGKYKKPFLGQERDNARYSRLIRRPTPKGVMGRAEKGKESWGERNDF